LSSLEHRDGRRSRRLPEDATESYDSGVGDSLSCYKKVRRRKRYPIETA